jgi:ParB-like nuclease domain
MAKTSAVSNIKPVAKRIAPTTSDRVEGASARQWLRVSSILVDPDVQRTLRKAWAREIADNFDPDRIRVIVVSYRADGKYYVIDGQHRLAALKAMGYDNQLVDCSVFDRRHMSELEVKKEDARLFLELNRVLHQAPIEAFQKAVVAEDPTAVAINRIVVQCGLFVAAGGHQGAVAAVAALRRVYGGCGTGKNTPDVLISTLETIVSAWGRGGANFNQKILNGMGLVFIKYGKHIDRDSFVKKLSLVPGGASSVLGSAGTLSQIRHTDIAKCTASVLVDVYNRGRKDKLESWWV